MPSQFTRYVILLDCIEGVETSDELKRAHVSHLKDLDKNGKLVICGPFTNHKGGMVVINAASLEESKLLAEKDPFVSSGVRTYKLYSLELSCEENNHLGMG